MYLLPFCYTQCQLVNITSHVTVSFMCTNKSQLQLGGKASWEIPMDIVPIFRDYRKGLLRNPSQIFQERQTAQYC